MKLLTWMGSMNDQEDSWPRSMVHIARSECVDLPSPLGEWTSKFMLEGYAFARPLPSYKMKLWISFCFEDEGENTYYI